MSEANRLDSALNNMKSAEGAKGSVRDFGLAATGACQPQCEPPGLKQLLYEAAHRHQEKAEGFRMLATLLPGDEALSWEVRRTLRAAIEELVSRR